MHILLQPCFAAREFPAAEAPVRQAALVGHNDDPETRASEARQRVANAGRVLDRSDRATEASIGDQPTLKAHSAAFRASR
jgi:hypothetical protein